MVQIESRFEGGEKASTPPDSGQLLALVDVLHAGTLNDAQRQTVQALRAGILALAENGSGARVQMVWRRRKRLLYCKYPREGGREQPVPPVVLSFSITQGSINSTVRLMEGASPSPRCPCRPMRATMTFSGFGLPDWTAILNLVVGKLHRLPGIEIENPDLCFRVLPLHENHFCTIR